MSPPALTSSRKNHCSSASVRPIAVDLGLHERRGDVVARLGPLAGGDLAGVRRASRASPRLALLGRGDGVVGRVHQLGQLVEPLAVGTGDAHQLGDQARRQPPGDVVHEVALAALDDVVDDLAGQLLDRGRGSVWRCGA